MMANSQMKTAVLSLVLLPVLSSFPASTASTSVCRTRVAIPAEKPLYQVYQ
jgi:hypothetical protein